MRYFDPKDPNEIVTLTFDFGKDLNVGEELVAVTDVFIEPYCGIDSNMPQVLSGAAQLFGNFALQSVTLGKPGCQYAITVCAATNLNPRLCVGGILPIVKAALM